MPITTLRYVRFFAPAVILTVLSYLLAKIIKLSTAEVPLNFNDIGYNLSFLIIAAVYHYLPFRRLARAPFRADIDEYVRSELVKVSGLADDKKKLNWEAVSNVFYSLVDNDKSLEKRSEDVMFNGALMTSFADLTAITATFMAIIALFFRKHPDSDRAILVFAFILVISVFMQYAAKVRHIKLSRNQISYISQIKKEELVRLMNIINA